jgi:hypothetical protein
LLIFLKKHKLVKIFIQVACYFVISDCFAQNIRPTNFDNRPICEQTGGIWRKYGNSCDNDCQSSFEKYPNCLDTIVYSCDCGPNNCWNGNKCLSKKEYQITFNQLQRKKLQVIDNQKDQEGKLKKSHEKQDPSLFSVVADKVKTPVNSIIKQNSKPQEKQTLPIVPIDNVVQVDQKPTTNNSSPPATSDQTFSVPPVFSQLMDQKAARQLDKAATNSIINAIGNGQNP